MKNIFFFSLIPRIFHIVNYAKICAFYKKKIFFNILDEIDSVRFKY